MNNKNVILGILSIIAIVLASIIIFVSPQQKTPLSPITTSSLSSSIAVTSHSNISIKVNNKPSIETSHSIKNKEKVKKRQNKTHKLDSKIKAQTLDHSRTYLIELIDESAENKQVTPTYSPKQYRGISGKIDGNFYLLKVPKNFTPTEQTKLRIVNLKTKDVIEKKADFLSEILGYEEGTLPQININTHQKNGEIFHMRTQEPFTGENAAVPHL